MEGNSTMQGKKLHWKTYERNSLQRKQLLGLFRSLFLLSGLILLLMGCSTPLPYSSITGNPGEDAAKYTLLKGTHPDLGNNAYFAENSSFFREKLEEIGYEAVSYDDAELFIYLSYGFGMRSYQQEVIKPEYNELRSTTEWRQIEEEERMSAYFTLRAVDADDYRSFGLETEFWSISGQLPLDDSRIIGYIPLEEEYPFESPGSILKRLLPILLKDAWRDYDQMDR